jgi:serine/threonine-protein kinase
MSINSVATLLAVLRRIQLLEPDQVDEIARDLGPHFDDPLALAEYLAEIQWLTEYQVKMLFTGNWEHIVVGPYHVLDRLGEGGISEVFKAWDTSKGRIVALKMLRQHLASKDDAVRQFQRELQAVTRLSHPNIIKTFDAGQVGSLHYFAMEFVEGMDLERYVQKIGPLPIEQACDCIRQVAQGLQHAHQLGLVHRDVKPANLFLIHPALSATNCGASNGPPRRLPDPVVKIIDWGLARVQRGPGETGSAHGTVAEKGALVGTADYIAPEQAQDPTVVDTRADIYSLGCTLYYLLIGRPPFPGPSLMQKLMQHQQAEPEAVQQLRSDVPDELAAVLQRMMAKKPEERFQIPLLVVGGLRRFCPGAATASGMMPHPVLNGTTPVPGGTPLAVPAVRPGAAPKKAGGPPSSLFNVPSSGSSTFRAPPKSR